MLGHGLHRLFKSSKTKSFSKSKHQSNTNSELLGSIANFIFLLAIGSYALPATANPGLDVMLQAGNDFRNMCNTKIADQITEELLEHDDSNLSESDRRNLHAYSEESAERKKTSGGGGIWFIRGNGSSERQTTNASRLNNEDFEKLKNHIIQKGQTRFKFTNPLALGQDCSTAVEAYNKTAEGFFKYLTDVRISDNKTEASLAQTMANLELGLTQSNNQTTTKLEEIAANLELETEQNFV